MFTTTQELLYNNFKDKVLSISERKIILNTSKVMLIDNRKHLILTQLEAF